MRALLTVFRRPLTKQLQLPMTHCRFTRQRAAADLRRHAAEPV
jgi:hypothetical protein